MFDKGNWIKEITDCHMDFLVHLLRFIVRIAAVKLEVVLWNELGSEL